MQALGFRNLLEAGDADGLLSAWASLFPGMPRPETRDQATIVMHHARTQAESLPLRARAWSHRWLCERALPSGLPDRLKPSADRIYPVAVEGVFLSINFRSEWMKPAAREVSGAVEDAINDAYAERRTDPPFVRSRMRQAKQRAMRALFGM